MNNSEWPSDQHFGDELDQCLITIQHQLTKAQELTDSYRYDFSLDARRQDLIIGCLNQAQEWVSKAQAAKSEYDDDVIQESLQELHNIIHS